LDAGNSKALRPIFNIGKVRIAVPGIFAKIDRLKVVYDRVYAVILFICKILLIADILITSLTVAGRYISFIPDPVWSEEVILTLMTYMAVLSAALAIRRGSHIRMSALDRYLPKTVLHILDLLADVAVMALAYVMITVGLSYALKIGAKATYISMTSLSKFWMYFPIPLAGIAMVVFELESFYNHIKAFFISEPAEKISKKEGAAQ
jgi:TRAP-type C4-dicarboxylate transport system permease small subunit